MTIFFKQILPFYLLKMSQNGNHSGSCKANADVQSTVWNFPPKPEICKEFEAEIFLLPEDIFRCVIGLLVENFGTFNTSGY